MVVITNEESRIMIKKKNTNSGINLFSIFVKKQEEIRVGYIF